MPSHAGSPEMTLRAAVKALGDSLLEVERVSSLYATACFPAGAGPDYVNAAAVLSGIADAGEILAVLHRIEAAFGRERDQRWGRRTLDLDLIALGDAVLPDAESYARWRDLAPDQQVRRTPDRLILPHPRLQDRAFVLVPLAEIAPDWRHPVSGLSVAEMAAALDPDDLAAVRRLG